MWSNVVFANDIKDFEIEGMSIETSLLNFFKEEKIISSKRNYNYSQSGFYAVGFDKEDFFETYDTLEIHLKTYDKSYKIYSIDGLIFYRKLNLVTNPLPIVIFIEFMPALKIEKR